MPHELISAVFGNLVASALSRLWPPRQSDPRFDLPPAELERRNVPIYRALCAVAAIGFASPVIAIAAGWSIDISRVGWFFGLLFGLPFILSSFFVGAVWLMRGRLRVEELFFYFERREKVRSSVFLVIAAPLALLGIASCVILFV